MARGGEPQCNEISTNLSDDPARVGALDLEVAFQ